MALGNCPQTIPNSSFGFSTKHAFIYYSVFYYLPLVESCTLWLSMGILQIPLVVFYLKISLYVCIISCKCLSHYTYIKLGLIFYEFHIGNCIQEALLGCLSPQWNQSSPTNTLILSQYLSHIYSFSIFNSLFTNITINPETWQFLLLLNPQSKFARCLLCSIRCIEQININNFCIDILWFPVLGFTGFLYVWMHVSMSFLCFYLALFLLFVCFCFILCYFII